MFKGSVEKISDRLIIYRPPMWHFFFNRAYAYISILHYFIDWVEKINIERVVKKLNYKDALLVNFRFSFSNIMNSLIFYPKIYICNDEFVDSMPRSWQRKIYFNYEKKVAQKATICIAHSDILIKKLKIFNKNVHKLMPGHEFDLSLSKNHIIKKSGLIKVCYMGYIDQRLLLNWLTDIVKTDNMELYLVGPVNKEFNVQSLCRYSNFKTFPAMEGEQLQTFLLGMDVCIIPYDYYAATVKECMPNKTFQYLACGKPVVVSDLKQFNGFPDKFIYITNNSKEFIDSIKRAYYEDNYDISHKRIEYSRKNSWNARGDQLYNIVQSKNADFL